jgi:IS1 family transposase
MFQTHRDTICNLLLDVGERCERYFSETIREIEVSSAECDEIWSWTGCREKTRIRLKKNEEHGDCWIHTAIDPKSKLLLCYHIGRRSVNDTQEFAYRLVDAVSGCVQVNTDGLTNYRTALPIAFGMRVHHAAVVKVYNGGDHEHRYSPARVTEVKKYSRWGNPDMKKASTSIVERSNLSIRTNLKRFARLTICFSKSRRHHGAMFSLFALWYNFCRPHLSLKKRTPAQAHGLADHAWTIRELLEQTAEHF